MAGQVTVSGTNDATRALLLFEELAHRAGDTNITMEGRMRTAQEAFAAWNRKGEALFCMDYAFLYVVMARAVGIKAYDVDVEEEADGQQSPHSCAAIFLGNQGLLVDSGGVLVRGPTQEIPCVERLGGDSRFHGTA